jgi:Type of WD40 repeat
MEYFQDDIFVPTVNTQIALCTAQEWFEGLDVECPVIDLRPIDMIPCSSPRLY